MHLYNGLLNVCFGKFMCFSFQKQNLINAMILNALIEVNS